MRHGGKLKEVARAYERVRRQLEQYCGRNAQGVVWIVEALRGVVRPDPQAEEIIPGATPTENHYQLKVMPTGAIRLVLLLAGKAEAVPAPPRCRGRPARGPAAVPSPPMPIAEVMWVEGGVALVVSIFWVIICGCN